MAGVKENGTRCGRGSAEVHTSPFVLSQNLLVCSFRKDHNRSGLGEGASKLGKTKKVANYTSVLQTKLLSLGRNMWKQLKFNSHPVDPESGKWEREEFSHHCPTQTHSNLEPSQSCKKDF